MKNKYIFFGTILFLSVCSFTNGENTKMLKQPEQESLHTSSDNPDPILSVFQDTLYSNILGAPSIINISLPDSFYETPDSFNYPVFLLLENEFFPMVSGVISHLGSVERMPETIVVSLRDGPVCPLIYTNGSNFWPGNEQLGSENAELFTEHLKKELFPYLKEQYRANNFSMVMGASYTSIYALHAFTREPELFDAHIAIASGDILGMGYEKGERFIDLFESDLRNQSRRHGFLYVTSAEGDGGGRAPEIKANLEELETRLAPYRSDNFKFISKAYPNEGHYDVALPGLTDALNMIFPIKKWYVRYRELISKPGNAMDNIDAHFNQLSEAYGFSIRPRADRWRSGNRLSWVGPYLLRQGRIKEAISVIERWVSYRPKVVKPLLELAKAYEANNELEKAFIALEKAQAIAKASGSELPPADREKMLEIKKKI